MKKDKELTIEDWKNAFETLEKVKKENNKRYAKQSTKDLAKMLESDMMDAIASASEQNIPLVTIPDKSNKGGN